MMVMVDGVVEWMEDVRLVDYDGDGGDGGGGVTTDINGCHPTSKC